MRHLETGRQHHHVPGTRYQAPGASCQPPGTCHQAAGLFYVNLAICVQIWTIWTIFDNLDSNHPALGSGLSSACNITDSADPAQNTRASDPCSGSLCCWPVGQKRVVGIGILLCPDFHFLDTESDRGRVGKSVSSGLQNAPNWPPNSNLANLVIYLVFINKINILSHKCTP